MSRTEIVSVSRVLEQGGQASSIPTDRLNALELERLAAKLDSERKPDETRPVE